MSCEQLHCVSASPPVLSQFIRLHSLRLRFHPLKRDSERFFVIHFHFYPEMNLHLGCWDWLKGHQKRRIEIQCEGSAPTTPGLQQERVTPGLRPGRHPG